MTELSDGAVALEDAWAQLDARLRNIEEAEMDTRLRSLEHQIASVARVKAWQAIVEGRLAHTEAGLERVFQRGPEVQDQLAEEEEFLRHAVPPLPIKDDFHYRFEEQDQRLGQFAQELADLKANLQARSYEPTDELMIQVLAQRKKVMAIEDQQRKLAHGSRQAFETALAIKKAFETEQETSRFLSSCEAVPMATMPRPAGVHEEGQHHVNVKLAEHQHHIERLVGMVHKLHGRVSTASAPASATGTSSIGGSPQRWASVDLNGPDIVRMEALQEASDHQKFSLLQVVTKLPELSNEVSVLNTKWDANTQKAAEHETNIKFLHQHVETLRQELQSFAARVEKVLMNPSPPGTCAQTTYATQYPDAAPRVIWGS